MARCYSRNGKLTKLGIKEHNEYLREGIRQFRMTIDNLHKCEMKGHRCAQGHCIRKLLRIIYHLLSTGQTFDPALLI